MQTFSNIFACYDDLHETFPPKGLIICKYEQRRQPCILHPLWASRTCTQFAERASFLN